MAVKIIFFDAAGTLIKPARSVGETYAAIARRHGLDVAPAEISERFRRCFQQAPPLAFPGVQPAECDVQAKEWWRSLVARVFAPWSPVRNFERYFTELFEHFARPEAWMLYPEVCDTLQLLRAKGLALAVISNFDSRLHGILRGLGVYDCFTEVFISSHTGHAKPAPELFALALSRLHLLPEDAVHVGDSEQNDLLGACNAGLTGVLVDRDGQAQESSSERCFRITNLKELPPLLRRIEEK